MKYKILYTADLLLSWEKRSAVFEVDLSDEEVEQIRSVVEIGDTKRTYVAVRKRFGDLYSKLFDAALQFMWYTVDLDIRISGKWEEIAQRKINEKALMKEDVDCNGFDPHDKDGRLLRGQDIHNAWIKWEEEHLSGLPFEERSHYYQRRYDINDVNYDDVGCAIEFPSEIIDPEIERQKKLDLEAREYPITFILDYWGFEDNPLKTTFDVSLTTADVERIKEIVPEGHENDAYKLIYEKDSRLYSKISNYAMSMEKFAFDVNERRNDRYDGELYDLDLSWVKDDDIKIMKEDIKNGKFDPHDEKGTLLEGEDLFQHWLDWEQHQLDGLPYGRRVDFYYDRYGIGERYDYSGGPVSIPFYFSEDFFAKEK